MSSGKTINASVVVDIQGKADQLESVIKRVRSEMSQFNLGEGATKSLSSTLSNLQKELDKLREKTVGNKLSLIDEREVKKSVETIDRLYGSLIDKLGSNGIASSGLKKDVELLNKLAAAENKYNKEMVAAEKEQQKLTKEIEKQQKKLTKEIEKQQKALAAEQSKKTRDGTYDSITQALQDKLEEIQVAKKALQDAQADVKARKDKAEKNPRYAYKDINSTDAGKNYNKALETLQKLEDEYKALKQSANEFADPDVISKYEGQLDEAKRKLADFNNVQTDTAKQNAFKTLKDEVLALDGIDWNKYGVDINQINSYEDLKKAITQVAQVAEGDAKTAIQSLLGVVRGGTGAVSGLTKEVKGSTNALHEMADTQREVDALKQRLVSFFSITNSVQLFKRSIRSAYNTIKELDAAMTEMAVVTDLNIGDYWQQLPEYTARAKELGLTIKDVYESMTLYYQQGLDTAEATSLSNATLKMARIAGLDAADATNRMTAALRGFNMELNETSAVNVADVYSKLAAITASNVDELSTAMSKVSSIANTAGMSFENTSAFLAQIIETTREAPETAGTALKTVIARFSEVKKLTEDGLLSGTDENGDAIEVNKIDKALRMVGISMKDFFNGTEGLDSIFMQLAEKWDTLDAKTQKYIATQAAGSRQQSRFIAMMSDYARQQELVSAANNAAGASDEQYEKTLDSLQTKLNQLKDAWDSFTMGLIQSDTVKLGITLLTDLLDIVNGLTNAFGQSGGAIAKFGIALAGIKLGKAGLTKFTDSLIAQFLPVGQKSGEGFKEGFAKRLKGGFKSIISGKSAKEFVEVGDDLAGAVGKGFLVHSDDIFNQFKEKAKGLGLDEKQLGEIQQNFEQAFNSGSIEGQTDAIKYLNNELGINGDLVVNEGMRSQHAMQRVTDSYMAAAAACGVLAMALGGIGQLAEKAGNEKLAKTLNDASVAAGILGVTLMVIPAFLKAIGREALLTQAKLGTIGIALAAIAAIAVAVIAIARNAEEASPEGQLKKAQEATKQAKEAADEAAEAYNKLKDAITGIGDAETNLDTLVKGTKEWKEAILELNGQVLNLISEYPELAKFATQKDGHLTIDFDTKIAGKSAQDILDNYAQVSQNAQVAVIGANINETKKALDVEYSKLVGDNETTVSKEYINQLAIALSNGDAKPTFDGVSNYLKDISDGEVTYFSHRASLDIDGLAEFGEQLVAAQAQLEDYNEALAAAIISNQNLSEEQSDLATSLLNADYIGYQNEKAKKDLSAKSQEDVQKDYAKKVLGLKEGDYEKKKNGDIVVDGETYKAEDMRNELVEVAAKDNVSKILPKYLEAMAKLDSNISSKITSALNDGQGLTSEEASGLATARDKNGKVDAKVVADALGLTSGKLEELAIAGGYADGQAYAEAIVKGAETANTQWGSVFEGVRDSVKNSIEGLGEDVSIGLAKSLVEHTKGMSEESAIKYVKGFNDIIEKSNLGASQKARLEDYLSNVDWSDLYEASEAMAYMQEMGLDPTMMREFWDTATDGAGAFCHSLEEVLNLLGLIRGKVTDAKSIEEALINGKATDAQINELRNAGVDISGYQMTDEGWKASEKDAKLAARTMREQAATQAQNTLDQEAERVAKAKKEAVPFAKNENGNWEQWDQITSDYQRAITANLLGGLAGGLGMTQEEWEAAGQEAYEQLVLNGDSYVEMLQKGAAYTHAQLESADTAALHGGNDEAVRMSMQAEATSSGLDEQEVSDYADHLKEVLQKNINESITQSTADRLAIDAKQLEGGIKEVTENYEDWDKTIANCAETSDDYRKALDDMSKAAAKMLNISESSSKSLMSEAKNRELLERAANGDTQAYNDLQKAAGKAILEEAGLGDAAIEMADKIAQAADTDIRFGEVVEGDNELAKTLATMYQEAYIAAIQGGKSVAEAEAIAARLIESQGFEMEPLEMTEVEVTGQLPPGIDYKEGESFTANGITYSDIKPSAIPGEGYKYKMTIPGPAKFTKTAETVKDVGSYTPKKSGGGGGSEKKYENKHDKYYNKVQDINELLRERNKIETRYQNLLKNHSASLAEAQTYYDQTIDSLNEEYSKQKEMMGLRKGQIQDTLNKNQKYKGYAWYDFNKMEVQINWDKINTITNADLGEAVDKYISELEGFEGQMDDAEDAMLDIEGQLEDIKAELREQAIEFIGRLASALEAIDQKDIEAKEKIYDAINDARDDLLSSVKENIDAVRQLRDNQKTEDEIAEKQRRLAYLKQDTTGNNTLEIKRLEEELNDMTISYEDTLVDQALDDLQKEAANAAEQREREIEALNSQIEWMSENGQYTKQAVELMEQYENSGNINTIASILRAGEDWISKSALEIEKMISEAITQASTASLAMDSTDFDENINYMQEIINIIGKVTDFSALTGKQVQDIEEFNRKRNIKIQSTGSSYEQYADAQSVFNSITGAGPVKTVAPTPTTPPPSTNNTKTSAGSGKLSSLPSAISLSTAQVKQLQAGLNEMLSDGVLSGFATLKVDGSYGPNTKNAVAILQALLGVKTDGSWGPKTAAALKNSAYKAYKKGGLVDYTGPAWLDGTRANPEIVLNAEDSQHLIQLRDIMRGRDIDSLSNNPSGSYMFDVDINVDEIGSDYDVDQLSERVKSEIVSAMNYRNVNAINFIR